MMWQFEWNWLGYVWAYLIGGGLLLVAMMFAAEIVSLIRTGKSEQGTSMMAGIMAMLTISNTLLFGVVTLFVWDFKTAMLLVGGALATLAAITVVAVMSMALLRR